MRALISLFSLVFILSGCPVDDEPPNAAAAYREYYCSGCGQPGQDCCVVSNCFVPEGWDNGCNTTTDRPLVCNKSLTSGNGHGICDSPPKRRPPPEIP